MKNRIIPIEKLEGLMWKPGDEISQPPRNRGGNGGGSGNKGSFSIEELADSYVLHGVECNDEVYSLTWTKELLDGGNTHTQDDWVNRTDQLPDARDYYASLLALHKNKDGPQSDLVETVRKMFAKDFKEYWMMTASRINYKPEANDELIHHYGSSMENSKDVVFVGPDGYVNSKSKFENEMEALLGTTDCKEISEVFKWVTKKATYLFRINNRPNSKEERAVVLGVDDGDGFDINAGSIINVNRPARGVVAVRENFP